MKKTPLFLATICAFSLALTQKVQAITASDFAAGTTNHEGYQMPYRYYVPAGASNTAVKFPLIVFLHGSGEVGSNNTAQLGNRANGAMALAEDPANPTFLLAPQLTGGAWQEGNKQIMIHNIINSLRTAYPNIDPDRIYVTGLSYGCTGTWGSLQYAPNFYAAAVPISGSILPDMLDDMPDYSHVPTWLFHRNGDGAMDVGSSDRASAKLRELGRNAIYTRYNAGPSGEHNGWYESYSSAALRNWLFAQTRGAAPAGLPMCQITTPSAQTLNTDQATIALSGTATPPTGGAALTGVAWKVLNTAGSQIASGAASFTAPNWTATVPLVVGANRVQVIASGPSWSSMAGTTTFNDTVWVTRGVGGDVTAPSISITNPSTLSVSTTSSTIALAGTASDASGIAQITWTNGTASGSVSGALTSWTIDAIPLQPGLNTISVTARDPVNNEGSAQINVTYTVPAPGQLVAAYNAGTLSGSFLSVDDGVTTYAADPGNGAIVSGGSATTITPTFAVANTNDDPLFHSYRHGNHTWNIPVPQVGNYRVRLRFAANSSDGPGARVFNIGMEGAALRTNFDIRTNPATGVNTARDEFFDVAVNDGTLNIQFTNVSSAPAKINAIEVRTAPGAGLGAVGLTGGTIGVASSGSSQILPSSDWQVDAAGGVLGGTSDNGWYERLSQNGNFQAVVRLKSLSSGNAARAGLMVREGTGAGARMVFVGFDPSANSIAASRVTANQNAATASNASGYAYPNLWLMVERQGNVLKLAVSSADSSYTLVDTVTLSSLASPVDVGLFVTNGGGAATSAVFSDFEVTPLAIAAYNCGKTSAGNVLSVDDGVTVYLPDPNALPVVVGGETATINPTVPTLNTDDDELFQSYHYGNHSWNIPVPAAGNYVVTLRFVANSGDLVGGRLFNIAIEGTTVRTNFDIRSNPATPVNTARDEVIPVAVTDGVLNIQFTNVNNTNAKVNAIRVTPAQ